MRFCRSASLTRFLDNDLAEIDNNIVERAICSIVTSRQNRCSLVRRWAASVPPQSIR
jgi:hypothetical protein